MAGRFSLRRAAAPDSAPIDDAVAPAQGGEVMVALAEAPPETVVAAGAARSPFANNKLLDAKVRLHRQLIDEINLSALEKLPEDEIKRHVQQLISKYVLAERIALNTRELADFTSEILDEMVGLGPLEPLLK